MLIWIVIALLLIRGIGEVLSPSDTGVSRVIDPTVGLEPAEASLAVRFARSYLADASAGGSGVAQAEVSALESLGDEREVLTVACELRDARTLYLAVPVSRSGAGEVAVQGAPWIVAAPKSAGVAFERPRPLLGEDAGAIRALAGKFLPAYLAGHSARDLAYLVAPGAEVRPLGGVIEEIGAAAVSQIGAEEGRRRTVVLRGRFRDRVSGAVYPLSYRLALVRGGRWYVLAVEGASA